MSMELSYNRLRLKLEMVYRGLSVEEAKSQFNADTAEAPAPPPVVVLKKAPRRRITAAAPNPAKS